MASGVITQVPGGRIGRPTPVVSSIQHEVNELIPWSRTSLSLPGCTLQNRSDAFHCACYHLLALTPAAVLFLFQNTASQAWEPRERRSATQLPCHNTGTIFGLPLQALVRRPSHRPVASAQDPPTIISDTR